MKKNLGDFGLDSAGETLLAESHADESVLALNHGDGVCDTVSAGIVPLTSRAFSDEEVSALSWKCRMAKSSPGQIVQVLQQLPEACIMRTVEEFRSRSLAKQSAVAAKKEYFILRADAKVDDKMAAVDHFLQWFERIFGDGTVASIKKAKGKLVYGMFASYVRDHPRLKKACGLSDGLKAGNKSYYSTLARYRSAIKLFFDRNPAVAENGAYSSVAEKGPESVVANKLAESAVAEFKPFEVSPFIN